MEEYKLNSTNLKSASWRPEGLTVTFHSGAAYLYRGVSREKAQELAKAPSAGKFFLQEIKDKFQVEKLEEVKGAA